MALDPILQNASLPIEKPMVIFTPPKSYPK